MDNRVSLQPAYVLHSRPFQNTSLLLDFFTLDYGRVRAVAKGARREKSRLRPLLQLFQPLLASFSGRGEVKTLTAVECKLGAIQLQGLRLFSGMYINELLTRLLHKQEEHSELYRNYQQALLELQGSKDVEPVLRRFELRLLAELGYAINLEVDCHSQHAIAADSSYRFTPEIGFEQTASLASSEAESELYPGAHLIALRTMDIADPQVARTAKRLLRHALAAHLGNKPLNSRHLFG